MQGFGVICRHRTTNRSQHKITGQQEKEVAESQRETRPLTLAYIDQVQRGKPAYCTSIPDAGAGQVWLSAGLDRKP